MKRKYSMLAVPLVAGLLFVAGCSDDDEAAPPAGPTNTPTIGTAATATRTFTAIVVNTPTHTVPVPTATATTVAVVTNTPTPIGDTATPTETGGETPTTTATPFGDTATPTATGGTPIAATCGNGITEGTETCDDSNNYGGDGCAANCTLEGAEADLLLNYGDSTTSTSFSIVQAVSFALNLTVSGSQVITHGSARTDASIGEDGHSNFAPGEVPIAGVIDKNLERLDPIQIPGIACACLRGIQLSSCGGEPVEPGITTNVCNLADGSVDPTKCTDPLLPCLPTFGPGVSSAGSIGCNGFTDADYVSSIDSISGETTFERSGGPVEVGAINSTYTAIGVIMGNPMCIEDTSNAANGPDGLPCTDDDPATSRGAPNLNVQVTGLVSAVVLNANKVAGKTIDADNQCGAQQCQTTAQGAPKSCEDLLAGNTAGLCLVSAFEALAQPSLGDIAVPAKFCAQ